MPNKTGTKSRANRLVQFADRLAQDTPQDYESFDDAFDALKSAVLDALEVNDEAAFDAAMDRLEQEEKPKALESLHEVASMHCQRQEVLSLTTQGTVHQYAHLFLVPVILFCESSPPENLTPSQADRIAHSFRKHGLIGENPTIALGRELLTLSQVNLSYCALYRVVRRLIQLLGPEADPGDIPAYPVPADEENPPDPRQHHLVLRFLHGITVDDDFFEPELFLSDPGNTGWAQEVTDLLNKEGILVACPLPPLLHEEALTEGIDEYRKVMLQVRITECASKKGMPAALETRPVGDDELEILMLDAEGAVLSSCRWPLIPSDDIDDLENMIAECLEAPRFVHHLFSESDTTRPS